MFSSRLLLALIVLVMLASVGTITPDMTWVVGDAPRWMLVTAIAAAGVKTSFVDLFKLGCKPGALLMGETLFIVAFVLAVVLLLRLGLA